MDHRDKLLKQMAELYQDQYGASLKQEAKALEESGTLYDTTRLDQSVHKITTPKRNLRYFSGAAMLVASILLVIMLPRLLHIPMDSATGNGTQPAATAQPSSAAAANTERESAETGTQVDDNAAVGALAKTMIPLSFALPENLTVNETLLDQGKTVYYLSNTNLDDIVMTLEASTANPADNQGLTPIEINQTTAYARSTADYSLLQFEKNDVYYVMTCQYDINTLIDFGKVIL